MATAGDERPGEPTFVFTSPVYTTLPEPYFPTMFVVRDLDGDGKVDLIVPGRDPDDRLLTLRGNGNGGFAIQQTLVAEGFVDWVELADVDGDGVADLVAAWRGSAPRLVVHRGLGGGAFGAPEVIADVVLGMGRDPQGIAVADFNADGDADVAVSSYVGQSVEIYANLGRGGANGAPLFARSASVPLARFIAGFAYPRLLAAGDLDGDGDADLVANEIGGGRIAVLRNEGGGFARAVEHRVPTIGSEQPGIAGLALVDADADGDLDVLTPALLLESEQRTLLFVNDGSGSFASTRVLPGPAVGYAFATAAADFDGDGDLDFVTGAALPGGVTFTRCDAAAEGAYARDASWPFGQLVRHVGAADVDGDCDLDLIAVEGPSRSIVVRRNATPQPGCGGVASAKMPPAKPGAAADVARSDAPPLPAPPRVDLDADGDVDAADRAIWLLGFFRALGDRPSPEVGR